MSKSIGIRFTTSGQMAGVLNRSMSDDNNEELESILSKLDKGIFAAISARGKLARMIERNNKEVSQVDDREKGSR
jgi:hypothetical protein